MLLLVFDFVILLGSKRFFLMEKVLRSDRICYWDASGNLAQMICDKQNSARLHEWDEENRLRFVLGEKYAGFYGYDGNG